MVPASRNPLFIAYNTAFWLDTLVPAPITKRARVAFKPTEDQMIWQSVALVQKYSNHNTHVPWVLISSAFPGRKPSSLARRWEALHVRKTNLVSRFLESFDRNWKAAQERGELEAGPLRIGSGEELKVVLEWYRENVGEAFDEMADQQAATYCPRSLYGGLTGI